MPDDAIHLEGEPARALAAHLTQILTGVNETMSETAASLMAAIRANTDVTASLGQAFEAFRAGVQARLDEALARVETEVAARVQAEADRDAITAAIEQARTAIEADTAQETEILNAVTANTSAQPPAPTPEPTPEPAPAEPPVDAAPVETVPVDTVPVTDPAVATDPTATPGDPTPATNGIGQTFNADGTPAT